jgi:environmental stress-induced protein Ves
MRLGHGYFQRHWIFKHERDAFNAWIVACAMRRRVAPLRLTYLPAAERVATSWKNGGGMTWQIASEPPGAGYAFDWRISLAKVAADGPFSSFPGVDRLLTVLKGAMRLSVAGRASIVLDANAAPYSFPGDAACAAELIAPVVDLNLMARRDSFRAAVETIYVQAQAPLGLDGDTIILFVATGQVEIMVGGDWVAGLGELDAVRIDAPVPSALVLRSDLGARIQVLRLWTCMTIPR